MDYLASQPSNAFWKFQDVEGAAEDESLAVLVTWSDATKVARNGWKSLIKRFAQQHAT